MVQLAQLMIAVAVFFTYALVFYVPMKVIRPFFLRYFSKTHPSITDGVLRTGLIVFTCKFLVRTNDKMLEGKYGRLRVKIQ